MNDGPPEELSNSVRRLFDFVRLNGGGGTGKIVCEIWLRKGFQESGESIGNIFRMSEMWLATTQVLRNLPGLREGRDGS
jgi:hypothetical protein